MRMYHPAVRAVFLIGGMLLASGPALAQKNAKKVPQTQSDSMLGQCIAQLHATHAALKAADHDYGGHRVQAMKAVHAASKELKAALKYEKVKTAGPAPGARNRPPTGAGAKTATPLPQAQSDAILQQAVVRLQAAKTELQAADHDYGGHRTASVTAIDRAVTQLGLALQYRATKAPK